MDSVRGSSVAVACNICKIIRTNTHFRWVINFCCQSKHNVYDLEMFSVHRKSLINICVTRISPFFIFSESFIRTSCATRTRLTLFACIFVSFNCHWLTDECFVSHLFHVANVVSEESILKWYKDGHSQKGKMHFLEQMKKFVEWLENAEEESDSEEED